MVLSAGWWITSGGVTQWFLVLKKYPYLKLSLPKRTKKPLSDDNNSSQMTERRLRRLLAEMPVLSDQDELLRVNECICLHSVEIDPGRQST